MGQKEIREENDKKRLNSSIGWILLIFLFLFAFIIIPQYTAILKLMKWISFLGFAFSVIKLKLINKKR
jgi:hypothetical protein